MKSTVNGNFYIICGEDCRYPEKFPRKKTDTNLEKLHSLLKSVKTLFNKISDETPELRDLLNECVLYGPMELDYDGNNSMIDTVLYDLERLQNDLKNNRDEIPLKREDWITLEDIGYKPIISCCDHIMYEKELESTNEKQVVEEIQYYNNTIFYRKRTTYWKISPGCKESTKIDYEKLRLTAKLKKIILRSVKKGDK